MRLLHRDHSGTICLTGDLLRDIPKYAILSHTWGDEEVTFQDLKDGTAGNKSGYDKIRFCGEQAFRDGLSYFWVDTCCIDKSSSAELSEAINSMFSWYRDAARCYVYLADISVQQLQNCASEQAIRQSRWFTRGWTLQELLAPSPVEFFSREGISLGDKSSLEQVIHETTHIPVEALRGTSLSGFEVSERLAWMESRNTTREEDKAYALFGIFDVNMPLIYGEGRDKAFRRLQEEIKKISTKEGPILPIASDAIFDSRAEEHNARCHPDTRVELLKQIEAWASDPHGKCIFWLNGMAGTGKSTISRTVAGRFRSQACLGASFFFKRGERDRGNAALLFTTIASQLSSKDSHLLRSIKEAADANPAIATKSLREQFDTLILQPLDRFHRNSQYPGEFVWVVDALDECDHDNDIKLIIHLFSETKTLRSIKPKIFITSRPELPIRLGFKNIKGDYQDIALHQIPQPIVEKDINTYLSHELLRIRDDYNSQTFEDQRLPPIWPGEDVIQKLVRIASPLFIFAATVSRFIADQTWQDPAGQLAKVLDYRNISSEDSTLDLTYLPILEQLTVNKTGPTKARLTSEFREIVGSIIILAEPLSTLSLSHLLGIPTSAIIRVLNYLHAVIDIPSSIAHPIRTFHLSFRDFLVDPAKRHTNEFWIDDCETHHRLATLCIHALQAHLKKDICKLGMPGKPRTVICAEDVDKFMPPHIQYACRYWVTHLKQSKLDIRDGDQIHLFLKRHFLHWLEALSIIGKISKSIALVTILQNLVQAGHTELSSFLQDAYRFILSYMSVIDATPLQLYSSLVIFAPTNSMIRDLSSYPDWIITQPEAQPEWGPCRQILEDHTEKVSSVAFSASSSLIASASGDGTVRLWDVATGLPCNTLSGHADDIISVLFSPGDTVIASASYDGTIKLWDPVTGQCLHTLHDYDPLSDCPMTFSGEGTLLISTGVNRVAHLWNVATGQCCRTVDCGGPIYSMAFSAGNGLVLSGSPESINFWDMTGQRLRLRNGQFFRKFAPVKQISPGGTWLALAMSQNIMLWDLTTMQHYKTFSNEYSVYRIIFSPKGNLMVSALLNGKFQLWNISTGECLWIVYHFEYKKRIIFSPDETVIAFTSENNTIELRKIDTAEPYQKLQGHDDIITSFAFSSDSSLLASGSADGTIKVWVTRGELHPEPFVNPKDVTAIAFSPDKTLLALASGEGSMAIYTTETRTHYQTLEGTNDTISFITFSCNNALLASASGDGKITLWNIQTGRVHQILEGHRSLCLSMDFSSNNTLLVSSSRDGTIKLWNTITGRCYQTLEDWCYKVVFLSSGINIISVLSDRNFIRVRNMVTGKFGQTLDIHDSTITAVASSSDGIFVALASFDGALELWDMATSRCYQKLQVNNALYTLSFDATSSVLHTDLGTIALRSHRVQHSNRPVATVDPESPELPYFMGYGVSLDNAWITWKSEKLLWLPPDVRPIQSAILGSTVALISPTMRLLTFRFSADPSISW